MKQQRRYKEPQDTLWGKFLSGFMAVVFAMSTLTLIPIASPSNCSASLASRTKTMPLRLT